MLSCFLRHLALVEATWSNKFLHWAHIQTARHSPKDGGRFGDELRRHLARSHGTISRRRILERRKRCPGQIDSTEPHGRLGISTRTRPSRFQPGPTNCCQVGLRSSAQGGQGGQGGQEPSPHSRGPHHAHLGALEWGGVGRALQSRHWRVADHEHGLDEMGGTPGEREWPQGS